MSHWHRIVDDVNGGIGDSGFGDVGGGLMVVFVIFMLVMLMVVLVMLMVVNSDVYAGVGDVASVCSNYDNDDRDKNESMKLKQK